jgi:hypothetical protein
MAVARGTGQERARAGFAATGSTKAPNKQLPLGERLRRLAVRLGDEDLADLIGALRQEQRWLTRCAATPL